MHVAGEQRSAPRILVLVPGVPHRARGASTVLFYHYIEQLKESGYRLLVVLLLESAHAGEDPAEFRAQAEVPGRCEVEIARMAALVSFRGRLRRLAPASLESAVRERIREFSADLVLCFDIGAAAVASTLGLRTPRLVWLGDLNFQTFWLNACYDALESARAALRLPKIWLVCRRWKAAYRDFLRGAEVVVASASSVALLRKLGVSSRYLPYPWPVGMPFRSAGAHRDPHQGPRFLFCGTLSGLGSRSALRYLMGSLYGQLRRLWGPRGFEVVVTGARSLPDWVREGLEDKPEIAFLGYVDDLYAEMDRCHAAIIPIDVPVGNRSRIVTAMGYGLLVIAHPNTALGNPDLVSGETCLLAAGPHEFANEMARAYRDPDMAARIEFNARRCYERSFEPAAAGEMLRKAIEHALSATAPSDIAHASD